MTLGLTFAAEADVVYAVSATASSEYPSYGANFAIDTGPGSALTDWAAFGTGAGSTLDLDLGAVYTLLSANVTDRVTSGGGNGGFVGGLYDFTTQFSIQAFTSSAFTTPIGAPVVVSVTQPGTHSSPADFLTVVGLGGLTAEYLQYTVLATNGVNPGLSDINFTAAVPEPSTWVMLQLGFLGLGALSQWRKGRVQLSTS
jgi:hypothetical protein